MKTYSDINFKILLATLVAILPCALSLTLAQAQTPGQESAKTQSQAQGQAKAQQQFQSPRQAREEDARARFFKIATDSFASWDINGDSILNQAEISEAISNRANKSEKACLLSALKKRESREDVQIQKDQYTIDSLKEIEADPRLAKPYLSRFARAIKRLESTKSDLVLFREGAPRLETMHQGKTGDCYFIASVGAMVHARPQDLHRLICEDAIKSSYLVKFPGRKPIEVERPSDGELVTYSDAAADGIWLSVLEKAFARLKLESKIEKEEEEERGSYRQEDADDKYDKTGKSSEIYKLISGGRPTEAIRLLTGMKSKRYSFKQMNQSKKDAIKSVISEALKDRRIMVTSIRSSDPKDGHRSGHSLAVLDYDRGGDSIRLWNPWGNSKIYKSVGLKMEAGQFSMPLEDWLSRFSSVAVEQNQPAAN